MLFKGKMLLVMYLDVKGLSSCTKPFETMLELLSESLWASGRTSRRCALERLFNAWFFVGLA